LFPTKRKTIPAWLLSALLHLIVVVALSLLFARVTPTSRQLPQRPVSIVLTRTSRPQTEYLSQEAVQAQDGSAAASSVAAAESLPSLEATAPLFTNAIKLPSANGAPLGDSLLVETPQFTVSGNARVPSNIDPASIQAEKAARRMALEARGPAVRVGLFGGAAADGRSFVFLIDRSKSMGDQGLRALQAAEQELVRALAALQPKHWFQVIAYHHKCSFLNTRELLKATDENKAAVQGHVSGLAAFGATEHEMALMSALYLKPDVIFLLTDGGEPPLNDVQLRRIRKLASGQTSIHCIQFGFGPLPSSDSFLHRLAAQNGGGYGYVDMSK